MKKRFSAPCLVYRLTVWKRNASVRRNRERVKWKVVSKMTDCVQFLPISRLIDRLSNNVIIQVAKQKGVLSGTKNTEDEKKSPFANRNYTTPATPSYERGENIEKPTSTEKIKKTEKKGKNKAVYVIPRLI